MIREGFDLSLTEVKVNQDVMLKVSTDQRSARGTYVLLSTFSWMLLTDCLMLYLMLLRMFLK